MVVVAVAMIHTGLGMLILAALAAGVLLTLIRQPEQVQLGKALAVEQVRLQVAQVVAVAVAVRVPLAVLVQAP